MKIVIKKIKRRLKDFSNWFKYLFVSKVLKQIDFIASKDSSLDNEIELFLEQIKENPIYFVPEIVRNDARLRNYKFKYGLYWRDNKIVSLFIIQSNGIIAGPVSITESDHATLCGIINTAYSAFRGKKNTGSFYQFFQNIDATLILNLDEDTIKNLHIRKGKGLRKDIKTAIEKGIIVKFNDLTYLRAFSKLHSDHLRERSYSYSMIYAYVSQQPKYYSFAAAIDSFGNLLSGAIIISYRNRSMFWLSATSERGKSNFSQAFCLYETIKYCYSHGITMFDFGGVGFPKLNQWDDFKKNFGSQLEIKYRK